jgi:hypothetical protein
MDALVSSAQQSTQNLLRPQSASSLFVRSVRLQPDQLASHAQHSASAAKRHGTAGFVTAAGSALFVVEYGAYDAAAPNFSDASAVVDDSMWRRTTASEVKTITMATANVEK